MIEVHALLGDDRGKPCDGCCKAADVRLSDLDTHVHPRYDGDDVYLDLCRGCAQRTLERLSELFSAGL